MRNNFYLQRYFSSKGPLHIMVMAILKERTRICPVRWLQKTTMLIHFSNILCLPVINIEEPVQSKIQAQRNID